MLVEREGRLGVSWKNVQEPSKSGTNRHCLLDVINTDLDFDFWLQRIEAMPDFLIEDICRDAMPYGLTLEETNAAIGFLKSRRDTIRKLINDNRAEFTSIKQWSLPL